MVLWDVGGHYWQAVMSQARYAVSTANYSKVSLQISVVMLYFSAQTWY